MLRKKNFLKHSKKKISRMPIKRVHTKISPCVWRLPIHINNHEVKKK